MHPCSIDGCDNPAAKGGLCWGHHKRRQRGRVISSALSKPSRTPWAAVQKSALAYAEADSGDDREWERASEALRAAVHRYTQSLPSFRALLKWVGRQERFRRGALKQLRRAPPIPSLHSLKWTGPETLRELREARK